MNYDNYLFSMALIGLAYLLGCFNGGYYYGKLFKKIDIRTQGSTNPGALNTLRVFGKFAFIVVFAIDFTKGLIAVGIARYFNMPQVVVLSCLGCVVLGHIYPIQLGFKGGKGVAAILGGIAMYQPKLIAVIAIIFVLNFPLIKKFSISGILALALLIPVDWLMREDVIELSYFTLIIALILYRHKTNIKTYLESRFQSKK